MKPLLSAFISGLIFALGLAVGGMTIPNNVIGFLDLTGVWKPALMFVMGGAILVYAVANRLILRRKRPVFGDDFHVPKPGLVDSKLLLGSAVFGIGWGLGGFCPGPALTAIGAGASDALIFGFFMLAGMGVQRMSERTT